MEPVSANQAKIPADFKLGCPTCGWRGTGALAVVRPDAAVGCPRCRRPLAKLPPRRTLAETIAQARRRQL